MQAVVYSTESQEEEEDRLDQEVEEVKVEQVWRHTESLLPVETAPVIPAMDLSTQHLSVMFRL